MPMQEGDAAKKEGNTASPELKAFQFLVSDDRMTLFFDGEVVAETLDRLISEVCTELVKIGIGGSGVLSEAARRLREAVPAGPVLSRYTLFEGKRPVLPKEGEIVWSDEYFKTGFVVDPVTGAVDYRKRAGRQSVAEGEHLATMIPSQLGEDGCDVYGKTVPAPKPKQFRVRAGANVRFDEEEGKYYATRDGRIRYVGNVLSVDDVYTITGSVDLKTGNIKHPGALVISKNIEPEFTVEALGDIEVNGYVQNAAVTTKGSLIVHGGITGGPKSRIKVDGNIQAKFLQSVEIEAGGDVIVEHEIDQCVIKSRGAVKVPHGRIVGGVIIALGGVETGQVGSEAYIRTDITAGEDYSLKAIVSAKESELESHRKSLAKIAERLGPLKERSKSLPPKLREMATVLLNEATKVNDSIRQIDEELEKIREDSRSRMLKEVAIQKEIFPDALFTLPPLNMPIKTRVTGPIKIVIRDGDIVMAASHAK